MKIEKKKWKTKVLTFEELYIEENYLSDKNWELNINNKHKTQKNVFDLEKNKYLTSDLYLTITSLNSSEKICYSATTSRKSLFGEYDFEQKNMFKKKMCLNTEKSSDINCKSATTLNSKLICIFDSKNKAYIIQNLTYEEIKIGAEKEVFESIINTRSDYVCMYDDQWIKTRKCIRI